MTTRMPGWTPLRSLVPWLPLPPYLFDEEQLPKLRHELRAAGFEVAEVDARSINNERELLAALGSALNFPDYYRPNWDAFDDCIGDLMRDESAAVALVVVGAPTLLAASPYEFVRALHLLNVVVEAIERDAGAFRLEVLLPGNWKS